jgi:hypothetical protein
MHYPKYLITVMDAEFVIKDQFELDGYLHQVRSLLMLNEFFPIGSTTNVWQRADGQHLSVTKIIEKGD